MEQGVIEAAMYAALGVLASGLVALVLIPPFWRRAVRLNRRDIEHTLPLTPAEIAADKDQLRAEFAVATRRLETSIEKLESKVASRDIELGRKREIIGHLTAENPEGAAIDAVARERDQLRASLDTRDRQIAEADAARKAALGRVAEIEQRLEAARLELEGVVAEREAQKLEIVARDTELGNLRDRIAAAARAGGASVSLTGELAELRTRLASEQVRHEAALEQARATEAGRRALEIELEAGAAALASARQQLGDAQKRIDALTTRLVTVEADATGAAALRDETSALNDRLAEVEAANARLIAELASARKSTSPSSGPQPARTDDMALLRGKLLEIGHAVARLSAATNATAEVPLLPPPEVEAQPALPATTKVAAGPRGLAERIRALQPSSGGGAAG